MDLLGLSFVLQQNNDPKDTYRLCKGYLTKEGDGVLYQMTWPPQPPDLSPIVTVWDELDRRVKEKQPTSAQILLELIERMPSVCKAVIKAKGLKNLKSQIYFDMFNTFLVTT